MINTKLYIELNWTKDSVLSNVIGATQFQITKTELYVPVVTLDTENIKLLNGLLNKNFVRSVVWNEYKSKIQTVTQAQNDNNFKRILLDNSHQSVNRLFVMGFSNNAADRQD